MSIEEKIDLKARVLLDGQNIVDTMVTDGEPMDITMYAVKTFVIGRYGEQTIDAIGCLDRLHKYINKKYKDR